MSSKIVDQQKGGGGTKRKRGRNQRQRQQQHEKDLLASTYRNVTFHERPSSGRPGSPHRYFEHSFDVLFDKDGSGDGCDGAVGNGSGGYQQSTSKNDHDGDVGSVQEDDGTTAQTHMQKQINNGGNQVVHCHLNGLCIITAGNVLQSIIQSSTKHHDELQASSKIVQDKEYNQQTQQKQQIDITSLQYVVKVGKDSQSARGKMRTKNKKQKQNKGQQGVLEDGHKNEGNGKDHDGNVLPNDPLCEISLSDGRTVQLKCCVAGTVIELNQRLLLDTTTATTGTTLSLVKDPLLDGYLAVIMPDRGGFPPKKERI